MSRLVVAEGIIWIVGGIALAAILVALLSPLPSSSTDQMQQSIEPTTCMMVENRYRVCIEWTKVVQ